MGTTTKLGLPWPAPSAFVKAGAAAIQALAEAVEAELRGPLIATDGDGNLNWTDKVAEVPWDITDNPDRKRGEWDSATNAERLVIPTRPGYYFVSTSVRFAGKAEPDVYEVSIRTRQVGDAVGTGVAWASQRVELPANSTDWTQLSVSTLVRVADTGPRTGVAVRLSYNGSTQPPAVGVGINKFRAHWMSSL